jgi:hypothetical protein
MSLLQSDREVLGSQEDRCALERVSDFTPIPASESPTAQVQQLQRRTLIDEIKKLPWWDAAKTHGRFIYLHECAAMMRLDFWAIVEEIGGFHAMRMLIRMILVARGFHSSSRTIGGAEKVGAAADQE